MTDCVSHFSDVGIDDLCDTAVIEAKKWLEEKKSGSNSKSEFPHGTSAPNFVTLAHVCNSVLCDARVLHHFCEFFS